MRGQRVVIESPYAGDVERNLLYARACMVDCIGRGEFPLASHLLYTQPGVLDDGVPSERAVGMGAGLAWAVVADLAVFYADLGWSSGMIGAREFYEKIGSYPSKSETRLLGDGWEDRQRTRERIAIVSCIPEGL